MQLRLSFYQELDLPTVRYAGWSARVRVHDRDVRPEGQKTLLPDVRAYVENHTAVIDLSRIEAWPWEPCATVWLVSERDEQIRLGTHALSRGASSSELAFRLSHFRAAVSIEAIEHRLRKDDQEIWLTPHGDRLDVEVSWTPASQRGSILSWPEERSFRVSLWPCTDKLATGKLVRLRVLSVAQASLKSLGRRFLRLPMTARLGVLRGEDASWVWPWIEEGVSQLLAEAAMGSGDREPGLISLHRVTVDSRGAQLVAEGVGCRRVEPPVSRQAWETPERPAAFDSTSAEVIAEGGYALIRRWQLPNGTTIAVKQLKEMHPASVASLKREFRALRNLNHPNLPAVYELCERENACFFTMQLIEGTDVVSHARLRGDRLRRDIEQLVSAVAALHRARLVHCDVKPENVQVTSSGRLYLIDLGLVTQRGTTPEQPRAGTLPYMSPDRLTGKPAEAADDWYSVGAVLLQILTGRPPRGPVQPLSLADDERYRLKRLIARWAPRPAGTTEEEQLGELKDLLRKAVRASMPEGPVVDSEDMLLLAVSLMIDDPKLRPREDVVRAWLHLPGVPANLADAMPPRPFLGRADETKMLSEAFHQVQARRSPRFVLVQGEAGIGKTDLLNHLHPLLPDALVLIGTCAEREMRSYNAFAGVIEKLSDELVKCGDEAAALLTADAHVLAGIFPALQRVPLLSAAHARLSVPLDEDETRSHAINALRAILANLQRRSPVVIAIDDLHLADLDSLSMLDELFLHEAPPPVLFVGSCLGDGKKLASEILRRERRPTGPDLVPLGGRRREEAGAGGSTRPGPAKETSQPKAAGRHRRGLAPPGVLTWLVRDLAFLE
ncbi:MAG: AAA family ATPase [Polyangiaceae bacterium]